MTRRRWRWQTALVLGCCGALATADGGLRYDFAPGKPFIVDLSGHQNHGLATDAERVMDQGRPCLKLGPAGSVQMPEAALILGPRPERGFIELSVNPAFNPLALSEDVWEGWVVLVYVQKASGNGLPDGYNEIGLALHGPRLLAKVAGSDTAAPFAVLDTPLRQGQWTHLRLEWEPGRRALFVDGKLAAEQQGDYEPPTLDMFPAFIGRHPSSGKWGFEGLVRDVAIGVE